jgi:hypothetical protein
VACSCSCSPLVQGNINRYKALGGQILGCCGNAAHVYGFHCAACAVPSSDYSIRRSSGVANSSWALAGDFGMNLSWSRKWLAWLVGEVKAGRFPEVLEIIGSLDGKTALYWAKWEGWNARHYTGGGHVAWAHVSGDRAKGALDSNWFQGWPITVPTTPATPAPEWREPLWVALGTVRRGENRWQVRKVQALVKVHTGVALNEDGDFGPRTESAVKGFQRLRGLPQDGVVNADDWRALVAGAPTVARGSSGIPVGAIQAMLNLWGAGLREDKDFGGATQTALTKFQAKYRVPGGADGVAGPGTWTYITGS